MKKYTKISMPNIDSKIWDLEYKIMDLLEKLLSGNDIVLSLNNEGICAEAVGLYKLLDQLCTKFNIDPQRIIISTANALEKSQRHKIVYSDLVYLAKYKQINFDDCKVFDNRLKHFGIFIGRSNWNRLFLTATIFKNYKEKSILSFHYNLDTKENNCGFDELTHYIGVGETVDLCYDLLKAFPIKLDEVDSYPILDPAHLNILKYYNTIFLDVVCETYFTGNTFYPTEKTARPILAKTPFLNFGPTNFLSNMKKLGFKTFNNYWSEDYDNYNGIYRAQKIVEILEQLSNKPLDELKDMYSDMLPILEHNKSRMKELTMPKFYDTFKT